MLAKREVPLESGWMQNVEMLKLRKRARFMIMHFMYGEVFPRSNPGPVIIDI